MLAMGNPKLSDELRARPISPHLVGGRHVFFWRWHLTLYASILHRVTGLGLYFGALLASGWAMSLASGAEAVQSRPLVARLASGQATMVTDRNPGENASSALISFIETMARNAAA